VSGSAELRTWCVRAPAGQWISVLNDQEPCYGSGMLQVHVTSSDAPRVLAELIKSTQNEAAASPEIATQARLVREAQAQAAHARPSWQTLDTVDFRLLDPENDWTEV
jgi:hypothetical protein